MGRYSPHSIITQILVSIPHCYDRLFAFPIMFTRHSQSLSQTCFPFQRRHGSLQRMSRVQSSTRLHGWREFPLLAFVLPFPFLCLPPFLPVPFNPPISSRTPELWARFASSVWPLPLRLLLRRYSGGGRSRGRGQRRRWTRQPRVRPKQFRILFALILIIILSQFLFK